MAQQTIAELLNSFAEYIGTKDKEIIELINQKITQLKSDETMPDTLIQKSQNLNLVLMVLSKK